MVQEPVAAESEDRANGKSRNAFRTISEVADELGVPQHVLRFWETKFAQVKPMKRGGNRRYYRPEDIELLAAICHYLYTDGYTIKGVQKLLKEKGIRRFIDDYHEESEGQSADDAGAGSETAAGAATADDRAILRAVIDELKTLRKSIDILGD